FLTTTRVAEQNGVQRSEDLAAVRHGPSDRVGVFEAAVFGVWPVNVDEQLKGPRAHIAARCDVIPGEGLDRGDWHELALRDAEQAVGIELGRERFLYRGARYGRAAYDVVP